MKIEVEEQVMTIGKMDVWDRHFATDPSSTKTVPKGGRKITAIDTYARIKDATKEWGPMGQWGLRSIDIKIDGRIAYMTAEFFTPSGAFGMANSIDTHMKRGSDYVPDPEWGKKIQTDTITKALSYLGFSADIFFGMFDDSRYVEERRKEEATKITQEAKDVFDSCIIALDEKAKILGKEKYLKYRENLKLISDDAGRLKTALAVISAITEVKDVSSE